MLLTVKEDLTAVISANHDHPEILGVVVDVHVEDIFLFDPWNANGSPRLSILHGGVGIDVVEDHSNISYSELTSTNILP
jgi:hypothetical protein